MPKHNRLQAPPSSDGNIQMKVTPPPMRVKLPEIKIPDINVAIDADGIAAAVNTLAQSMNMLAQQQAQILQTINDHHAVLNKALGNQPAIKVEAPKVTLPPKPRSFTVNVEDGNGETTTMNIRADSSN